MDESRSAPAPVPRASAHEPDPLVGRLINERYKIAGIIARGGMGKVYRAEQAPLGRLVALKVLSPNNNSEGDPEFHRRFFLEASIASKLTHPNTVTIFDYGKTDDEVFYIAMELLEGRTLHRALREEGPFTAERTIHIAQQICRSLREAHGLGVIHRDLKPANVYLVKHGDENEFVKVLDFGLVKDLEEKGEALTKTGLFMGSPKYMSPEQIRSDKVDSRVDVYALGVMMYEMLADKVPFDRANSVNILMAHIHEQVPAMNELNATVRIPPALENVVRKCMAKNPDDRYSSMNDLLVGLKRCVGADVTVSGEHRISDREETTNSGAAGMPSIELAEEFLQSGSTAAARASFTPQATPFAQASKPSSGAGALFLAGVFALTGIGGFVALVHPFDSGPETAPVAATAPAPAVAPSALPVDPVLSRVLVTLRSTPSGATVMVGDQEYGPTPTQLEWTGPDAAYGRVVKFRFQHKGFQDLTVIRALRSERLDVEAPRMEALPPVKRVRPEKHALPATTSQTESGSRVDPP